MIEDGLLSKESDFIKRLDSAIAERNKKLEDCLSRKKQIEENTHLKVLEEAEIRKSQGDNSLGNENKRKPYYQDLLKQHEHYPTLENLINEFTSELALLEQERSFQKRKFYREMASIVAVVKEVSGE